MASLRRSSRLDLSRPGKGPDERHPRVLAPIDIRMPTFGHALETPVPDWENGNESPETLTYRAEAVLVSEQEERSEALSQLEFDRENGIQGHVLCGLEQDHVAYKDHASIPFRTLRTLGHGSGGRVEEVQSSVNGSIFACKVIIVSAMNKHVFVPAVQQEVETLKKLQDHPHIVKFLATYEAPRIFAIIMDPVADGDLEVFLERMADNGFPERRLVLWTWMHCLADALNFLHSQNVRHRDIKPKNIVWQGHHIFLTDFGSSFEFTGLTSSTEGCPYGITRIYCAPEVAKEDRRGRSADVFSLGCVFAEMATILLFRSVHDFYVFRESRGSHDFHVTVDKIDSWFSSLPFFNRSLERVARELIPSMLALDRNARPRMSDVIHNIHDDILETHLTSLGLDCEDCLSTHELTEAKKLNRKARIIRR